MQLSAPQPTTLYACALLLNSASLGAMVFWLSMINACSLKCPSVPGCVHDAVRKHAECCPSVSPCGERSYEDEEHPGVCQAMEHAARCFMFDANAAQVEGHEGNGQEQLQMQQEAAD